jgi:hypothetical protein
MSKWNLGKRIDSGVAAATEKATRTMARRAVLRTAVTGGAISLGALAVGQAPAFATEKCSQGIDCGPTRRCSGCPSTGCPSGYGLCKGSSTGICFNNQGWRCEWPSGEWIACNGAGRGNGYYICYDCKGPGGCAKWCTCLSACICCQCLTAADLVAEQKRIQAAVH